MAAGCNLTFSPNPALQRGAPTVGFAACFRAPELARYLYGLIKEIDLEDR